MRSMKSETPPLCRMEQMKTEMEDEGPVVRRTWVKNEIITANTYIMMPDMPTIPSNNRKMRAILFQIF